MKLLLCYNPFSGKKKNKRIIEYVKTKLETKYEVTMCQTQGPGSFTEIIKNSEIYYDVVVACGGDGTVNEVVSGAVQASYEPVVGIVPMGTINDMVHNLGLRKNYKKATRAILEYNLLDYNIYKVNDCYFSYAFAMGYMQSVSHKSKVKRYLGPLGYYVSAVSELFKFKKIYLILKTDDGIVDGMYSIMLVSNSSRVAGFKIKKYDKLEVVLFKGGRITSLFKFLRFLLFKKADYRHLTENLTIECHHQEFNTDGEGHKPVDVVHINKFKAQKFIYFKKK